MHSPFSGSPVSESGGSSRPSSITRSSRESFVAELETLPSESMEEYMYELNEEVLDIEDVSDDDDDVRCEDNSPLKAIEDEVNEEKNEKQQSPVESEIDFKIRKGLEKVKKLDKILLEKTEKEKEVKRSRRIVEKEFQSQVAKLIEEKGADKVWGSQQLLYLCASSDREDEDIEVSDVIEPIFPTQIDSEYYKEKNEKNSNGRFLESCSTDEHTSHNGEDVIENKQKKRKDFVKRNIRLASQAQELILLTDGEKKRLDELLADDSDLLMVENPFTSNVISTISGYQFSHEEQDALAKIDAQLKAFIPNDGDSLLDNDDDDGDSLLSNDEKTKGSAYGGEDFVISEAKCGEQVLQKGYDERRVACRLRDIDVKLKHLNLDEEACEVPVNPDLLRKLLDVDSRLTSDSISICESLRSNSSSLYSDMDATTIGSECDVDFDTSNSQLCAVTN